MPLRHSHRFDPSSGLGRIAAAIRAGDAETVISELRGQDTLDASIVWIRPETPSATLAKIVEVAASEYTPYLQHLAARPEGELAVLRSLLRFRVLCAHREGLWGELNIDRAIAEHLDRLGLIRLRRRIYLGQPVMVTRNDYRRELFNGDVGVVVREPAGDELAVLFESATGESGCRRVPAALVPESRSCYALTIHKSQGSEYHHVMLVLPSRSSPILTRELLYTGVTRVADERDPDTQARRAGKLYLVSSEAILRETIQGRIRRSSGLHNAIQAMATNRSRKQRTK
jgi:exodeoxyribonuclease V alpha subunit